MSNSEKLCKIAKEALEKKEVTLVLGWRKKDFWWQSPVAFIENPDDAGQLVWDAFTVYNPVKYLLDVEDCHEKIGVFVKGCDSRGINRLLQDKRLERDRVVLYGVPCEGKADAEKIRKAFGAKVSGVTISGDTMTVSVDGKEETVDVKDYLLEKCLTCAYPNPVVYDKLAWEEVPARAEAKEVRFDRVKAVEGKELEERYAYWAKQFERCLRCYACRNVCPACNCKVCIFDQAEPRWIGKASDLGDTMNYQIIRAFHVAGRCFECGECERVCPADIPLQELNRKLVKELDRYYGEYEAGLNPEDTPPLGTYRGEDPAGFDQS